MTTVVVHTRNNLHTFTFVNDHNFPWYLFYNCKMIIGDWKVLEGLDSQKPTIAPQ